MKAAMWWYWFSLLLFWGSTSAIMLVDLAGVVLFGITWPSGPDLFPNQVLGLPLAFAQILAAGALAISAWDMAAASETYRGAALRVLLAASTAATCLVAFIFYALWYQVELMRRPL